MAPELRNSGSHAPLPSEQEGATMSSVSIPNFSPWLTRVPEFRRVTVTHRGEDLDPPRVLAGMVIRFIWG